MKHIHTFENYVGEANISFYKSTVVDALKQLGYITIKQADLKIGSKKSGGYDIVTLNGESLCSSDEYKKMITWIMAAVTADPSKYGLDPDVIKK